MFKRLLKCIKHEPVFIQYPDIETRIIRTKSKFFRLICWPKSFLESCCGDLSIILFLLKSMLICVRRFRLSRYFRQICGIAGSTIIVLERLNIKQKFFGLENTFHSFNFALYGMTKISVDANKNRRTYWFHYRKQLIILHRNDSHSSINEKYV